MANGFGFDAGGGFGDFFGDFSFGNLLEAGTSIATSFFQPTSSPFPTGQMPAVRTMAAVPALGGLGLRMGGMLGGLTIVAREILLKIANAKNLASIPSLQSVISFARKAAPIVGQGAVAASLAITAEELATLIFAHATKKRRRMNPGNTKALRRSMRRIESFHRLCVRADRLRSPRRRTSTKAGAGAQFVRQG